jgi:RNA polymerase sigma-70 factor (ECF subfamily)
MQVDHTPMAASSGNEVRRAAASADARADAALLARVAARDRRAFESLYRAYHARLTRFLFNMTRRPSLVEEVLNDTLFFVWEHPERFNGASRLSTWIFAIAYRKALNALRRQDTPVEDKGAEDRPSEESGPERRLGDSQTGAALRAAVGRLSADHRAVIDLAYFHDMAYQEISEIMACPVDTVKTRMFHARRHLKRSLGGQLADWL